MGIRNKREPAELIIENSEESLFVMNFVRKNKKDRYLKFLREEKNRHKITNRFYHHDDFIHRIKLNDSELQIELNKIIDNIYVISSIKQFDKKNFKPNFIKDNIFELEMIGSVFFRKIFVF